MIKPIKNVVNIIINFIVVFFELAANVPALGEVANFGTDYFLLKIKFLAKRKREFTTKFAILPNACYRLPILDLNQFTIIVYNQV